MEKKIVSKRILRVVVLLLIAVFKVHLGMAQDRFYAGALGGIATLSGDARALITNNTSALSLYNPTNGVALDLLAGWSASEYASLQAGYIWNRNSLVMVSTLSSPATLNTYEESRHSSEHSATVDLLVYFRKRNSRLRPYLSVGTGVVHLSSTLTKVTHFTGAPMLPPQSFSSNMIGLRVPVGIDVALSHGWALRYTFSETISRNPVSEKLLPPGQHSLKNFQNLFGFVKKF